MRPTINAVEHGIRLPDAAHVAIPNDLSTAWNMAVVMVRTAHDLVDDVETDRHQTFETSCTWAEYLSISAEWVENVLPVHLELVNANDVAVSEGDLWAASFHQLAFLIAERVLRDGLSVADPERFETYSRHWHVEEEFWGSTMLLRLDDSRRCWQELTTKLSAYKGFRFTKVLSELDRELSFAVRQRLLNAQRGGDTLEAAPRPLTEQQERVLQIVKAYTADGPKVGKQIVTELSKAGIEISESTWTSNYVPVFRRHGLVNHPGCGYEFK